MPDAARAKNDRPAGLSFPFEDAPPAGTLREVAPGILWTRIALPFRLDHVNIYLIEDGDGWAVLDTGIADQPTRDVWQALASGPLAGQKLTRLIVTHFHPDHIGLAGWLCAEHDMPLLTSQTCYLGCLNISLNPGAMEAEPYRAFYRRHGMDDETAGRVATQGHRYLHMVSALPPTFQRLTAGDSLRIGARDFEIMAGDGHAPEQLMLYQREANILLAADQVLTKITPNISVWAVDPDGDPLGLYLRSLSELRAKVDGDALVLPGHQLPFYGLHERCVELASHHEERCDLVLQACREDAMSVAEIVPVMFRRTLDPHQLSFAFSEAHAHVNRLMRSGQLVWRESANGTLKAAAA